MFEFDGAFEHVALIKRGMRPGHPQKGAQITDKKLRVRDFAGRDVLPVIYKGLSKRIVVRRVSFEWFRIIGVSHGEIIEPLLATISKQWGTVCRGPISGPLTA
ncbi:MAG: hypothetical protein WCJ76_15065 [Comamonadaceae bacterium]